MARYRKIDPRIWMDSKFRVLPDDARWVFLLVLTHPHMTALGAMRASAETLALDLRWERERVRAALACLTGDAIPDAIPDAMPDGIGDALPDGSRDGLPDGSRRMLIHNPEAGYIEAPNFLRYNEPEGPNSVTKAWLTALDFIPECPERDALIRRCRAYLDERSDAFRKAVGAAVWKAFPALAQPSAMPSRMPSPMPSPMPSRIHEQEQEQEQEKKKQQRGRPKPGIEAVPAAAEKQPEKPVEEAAPRAGDGVEARPAASPGANGTGNGTGNGAAKPGRVTAPLGMPGDFPDVPDETHRFPRTEALRQRLHRKDPGWAQANSGRGLSYPRPEQRAGLEAALGKVPERDLGELTSWIARTMQQKGRKPSLAFAVYLVDEWLAERAANPPLPVNKFTPEEIASELVLREAGERRMALASQPRPPPVREPTREQIAHFEWRIEQDGALPTPARPYEEWARANGRGWWFDTPPVRPPQPSLEERMRALVAASRQALAERDATNVLPLVAKGDEA